MTTTQDDSATDGDRKVLEAMNAVFDGYARGQENPSP
jgi:hypothetical protein